MRPFGALIMGFFASIWWIAGVHATGHASVGMYAVPVVVMLGIIAAVAARRHEFDGEPEAERARRGRLVGWASAGEGLAIFLAVNVLANTGLAAFTVPAIAIIVGLHFVPLARWLPATGYYLTAVLLVALGAAGIVIADVQQRVLLVSLGAAALLWATSAWVLRPVPARR